MKRTCQLILLGAVWTSTSVVWATPSTTFWAPSTPYLQPDRVLHVTYDTYFWGTPKNSGSAPIYPVDTGLTMGLLPLEKFQLEAGFDLLLPGDYPLFLNAKVGSPEGTLFSGSPGWSAGIFGVGFKKGLTDYNVLHFMLGKTLPFIGLPEIGLYYGLNKNLFLSSTGEEQPFGVMAGWFSPDIKIEKPWLHKIVLAWDIMTGKNVFGATGGGIYFYITPAIDLLTGSVYFFDPDLQPGGVNWLWTMQLDIDMDLKSRK